MKFVVRDWLEPWTVNWPDKERGPWSITLRWRAAGDRVDCIGLSVDALDPAASEPVTATLMRSLPVARLIAEARQHRWDEAGGSLVEAVDDGQDIDISPRLVEDMRADAQPWSAPRPGRRVELGPDFYAEVAETYSAALMAGDPPLRAIERRWTTSRPTASRWVAAARRLEFLPATQQGKARGAELLPTENEEQR